MQRLLQTEKSAFKRESLNEYLTEKETLTLLFFLKQIPSLIFSTMMTLLCSASLKSLSPLLIERYILGTSSNM